MVQKLSDGKKLEDAPVLKSSDNKVFSAVGSISASDEK